MIKKKQNRILVVIGGGPAGLMAAGTAASHGTRVILLEKKSLCGRKLLLTGAGQCNITNSAPFSGFLDQYPENKKFLYPAFKQFFVKELKSFFLQYNVKFTQDDNGKYFPENRSAQSVLDALTAYCRKNSVEQRCQEKARSIARENGSWLVKTDLAGYQADSVIIATGGLSYPHTGSEGDGYRFATSLNHSIVAPRPALTALNISTPVCRELSGISLHDVCVKLQVSCEAGPQRKITQQTGDMLFTHFGVSGPPILFLSRWLPPEFDNIGSTEKYELSVDLFPTISQDELEKELLYYLSSTPKRQLKTVLSQNLSMPNAVAAMLVSLCFRGENILCHELTKEDRRQILKILKAFNLSIAGTRGYREAMVTAGGVLTKEISPRTMESILNPGIYFAGEVIDIDGNTGGYNLQAAFSTGYLAGKCAAKGERS